MCSLCRRLLSSCMSSSCCRVCLMCSPSCPATGGDIHANRTRAHCAHAAAVRTASHCRRIPFAMHCDMVMMHPQRRPCQHVAAHHVMQHAIIIAVTISLAKSEHNPMCTLAFLRITSWGMVSSVVSVSRHNGGGWRRRHVMQCSRRQRTVIRVTS